MSTITRTTKANGTTEWATGDDILAAEHNSEWNNLVNDYNGGITNDNVSGSADIDPSKVGDHATTNAIFLTTRDPGDSFSVTLPTDLEEEIESLRYELKWAKYGTNLKAMNSAGSIVTLGWTEPVITGRNLLPNPGFEIQSGGAGTAPDGWTLAGSPSTIAIENPSALLFGTEKRSLNIIGNGVGISRVVSGLKASTKYRVGIAYVRTANSVSVTTSGGLASGDYQDISFSESSSSGVAYQNFVFKTDSSGSDVTVQITTTGSASAEMNLYYTWMYEMMDSAPVEFPSIPSQSATDDTETVYPTGTFTANDWNWETNSALTLSQYVPAEGYRLTYRVTLSYEGEPALSFSGSANDTDLQQFAFRVQLDSGGGAATVAGPYMDRSLMYTIGDGTNTIVMENGKNVHMFHTVYNATAGSTYTFTTDIAAYNDAASSFTSAQLNLNPSIDSEQMVSQAELIVERD